MALNSFSTIAYHQKMSEFSSKTDTLAKYSLFPIPKTDTLARHDGNRKLENGDWEGDQDCVEVANEEQPNGDTGFSRGASLVGKRKIS